MSESALDKVDRRILAHLQTHARATTVELSAVVQLSPAQPLLVQLLPEQRLSWLVRLLPEQRLLLVRLLPAQRLSWLVRLLPAQQLSWLVQLWWLLVLQQPWKQRVLPQLS